MSESESRIQELMRQAEELKAASAKKAQAEKRAELDNSTKQSVEKISADREEQIALHEQNENHATKVEEAKQKITALEAEWIKLSNQKKEVSEALNDPNLSEDLRTVYEQIIVEADKETEKIQNQVAEHTAFQNKDVVKENNERINLTGQEAAEVLGLDERTRVLRDYFEQQREFLHQPEEFALQLEVTAEEEIIDITKSLREKYKSASDSKSSQPRDFVPWQSYFNVNKSHWGASSDVIKKAIKINDEKRDVNFWRSSEDRQKLENKLLDKQKKFEQDVFRNPLLFEALNKKRHEKIDALLEKIKNNVGNNRDYSLPNLNEAQLEEFRKNFEKLYISLPNSNTGIQMDEGLPLTETEIIAQLSPEDKEKIQSAVADSNKSFQDLAIELGLSYNENVRDSIHDEALLENAKLDKETKLTYLNKRLEEKTEELEEIRKNKEVSAQAEIYLPLRDQMNNRRNLERDIESAATTRNGYQTKLDQIIADKNWLFMVKDSDGKRNNEQWIAEQNAKIEKYENKIKLPENGGDLSTEELNQKFSAEEQKLVDMLLEHYPNPYFSLSKEQISKKTIENFKDKDEFIYEYTRRRQEINDRDRSAEPRLKTEVEDLESKIKELQS